MSVVTVPMTPLALARRINRDSAGIHSSVRQGVKIGAHRGRTFLTHEMPTGVSGHLRNAWRVIDIDGVITLHNDAPHAGIIEAGARPHKVSAEGREAIREWVRRVMGTEIRRDSSAIVRRRYSNLRGKAMGGFRKAATALRMERAIDNVVWGIVTKLGKEGFKGRFIVKTNLDKLREWVGIEIHRALAMYMTKGTMF